MLSRLFHPLLTGLYIVVAAALLGAGNLTEGLLWALLVTALAVGVPAADLALRVRSGRAGDFELLLRQERARPLTVALVCVTLAFACVAVFQGPPVLLVALASGLLCGFVLLLITTRWKISFHAAGLAAALALAVWYAGPSGLGLAVLLVAVGWSRLALGRHTPAQVLAGALVSLACCLAVLAVLG